MMWLDIAKGALLLFVVGGALFYVTAVVRKSRAAGSQKFKNPYISDRSLGRLQPPEWAHWDDAGDDDAEEAPGRAPP
jgi:hypothetical protein